MNVQVTLKRANLLFLSTLVISSCGFQDQDAQESSDESVTPSNAPHKPEPEFRHPLLGVDLIDGEVPGVDIQADPLTGELFAVGELTFQDEGQPTPTTRSGVIRVQSSPLTTPRKQREVAAAYALVPFTRKPIVAKQLEQKLENTPDVELVDVRIRLKDDFTIEHFNQKLDRSIGLGKIQTWADYEQERTRIRAERANEREKVFTPAKMFLDGLGATYRPLSNTNFIHATLTKRQILQVASEPWVETLNVTHAGEDKQAYCPEIPSSWLGSSLDGVEVSHGTQIQQFLCDGHDGSVGYGITAGIIESGVSDLTFGRFEEPNSSYSRLLSREGCGFFYCDPATSSDETLHATMTTNLLMGDLRNGQDPAVTSDIYRLTYSGYSPGLQVIAYALENGSASFETAVDELIGEVRTMEVVNISWGLGTSTPLHDCYGDWDEDEAVNSMYESGILPFVAAGNDGLKGCNISIPGSAMGAFTVGGTGNTFSQTNVVEQVRSGPIFSESSGGGQDGRSIVDIVAPAYRKNMFGFVSGGVGNYSQQASGTSLATPTVAAAAVNYMDFYRSHYSTWIDHPGALFNSMLLMGDRDTHNGKSSTKYDADWGAGRMLMRKFDSTGMDSPWSYGRYSTCVPDNNTIEFQLGTIPAAVDGLKVVLNWYDRRHDSNQTLDDLDLRVVYTYLGNTFTVNSAASYENKERIFVDLSNYGAVTNVKVIIIGEDVTADGEGCGTNKMKAFVGWYYEDNARDDADGPTSEILGF